MKHLFILITFIFFLSSGLKAADQGTNIPQDTPKEETLSEQIDEWFAPLVKNIGSVLFWDPFEAMGIYDPVVRDESGNPILDLDGKPIEKHFPLIVVWLVLGAIYFTIRMKFINIRGFRHALQLVQGKYDNPDDPGEVSHFQALATALSGTVGLGNIAGVAIAITVGGPGATFWQVPDGRQRGESRIGQDARLSQLSRGNRQDRR